MQRNGTALDECREVLAHRVTAIREAADGGDSESLQTEMPGPLSEDRTRAVEALWLSLQKLKAGLHGLKRAVHAS